MFWRGSDEDNFHNQFGLGLGHGGDFGLDLSNAGSEEIGNRLLDLWDVLTPRWRAVASSMIARVDAENANRDREEEGDGPAILPWIEAKFTLGRTPPLSKPKDENFGRFLEMGSPAVTSDHVPHSDMMQYRYHLDLVGGGSTTWADTLRKLAMPGLLFHHETLMRDWFYGELQPWVHYVPIRIDLDDLSDKYVWAETNPIEAETIARNGREFVLEMATEWAATRQQFGQAIGKFQGTSFKLADMATELEAAELLVLRAADMETRGEAQDQDFAMAKLYATEMLGRVTDHAVQIFGGMGLMKEFPIERFWRDARVERIWDGTSEIQRHIISRSLLRPYEN